MYTNKTENVTNIDWAAWLRENVATLRQLALLQCPNLQEADEMLLAVMPQLVRVVERGALCGTRKQWLIYVYKEIRNRCAAKNACRAIQPASEDSITVSQKYDAEKQMDGLAPRVEP